MKAIVMAGGEGTRLRPLTSGRPKPMVELFGRPVLEHTVELLKKNGIYDICFTLRYLPEIIKEYFGDGSGFGVNIEYRVEEKPLGTAGGVRACADFIGGEDVLILSGDAICSFDLGAIIGFHKEKQAEATLVLYEHPEPTEYGLVVTDKDGRITGFIEKPAWDKVVTNRVNTGIYVLSSKVISEIPEGREYDFGKNLFPKLLADNRRLYGVCAEGYWCDIGSPEAYRSCCLDILNGRADIGLSAPELMPGVWSCGKIADSDGITAPVYIGSGCLVESESHIKSSVIGDYSAVHVGAKVSGSVINGARIKKNALVTDCTIGRGTVIGEGAEVQPGCVIGDGADIGSGTIVRSGVRICSGARVPAGTVVESDITEEKTDRAITFKSPGVAVAEYPSEITAEYAVTLGTVLGASGRIGISFTGGEGARVLASALGCGVNSAGGEACQLDCPFEAALSYGCMVFSFDSAVFVRQDGSQITLTFFSQGGKKATRELERRLSAMRPSNVKRADCELVGELSQITGAGRTYLAGAAKLAGLTGKVPTGFQIAVSGKKAENRALRQLLALIGCKVTEPAPGIPCLRLEQGGYSLCAADEKGREIPPEKMLAAAALAGFKAGMYEIAAPYDAPGALDDISQKAAKRILWEGRDKRASDLLMEQRFMVDGIFAAALIVSVLQAERTTLERLILEEPEFSIEERRVETNVSKAQAMRMLTALSSAEIAAELSDGLTLRSKDGVARISPTRDGSALSIRSEAASKEAAKAICDGFCNMAKELK